ncbi:MAG: methyl-accepting chemotaxis protein [Aquabacterium sp.]|nr:methyl-accepting chemotaxis protein [Aquabacterium sp.]
MLKHLRLDTLYKSLLIPTVAMLVAAAIVAAWLTTITISQRMQAHQRQAAENTGKLLAGVAGPYVTNFDLTSIGNLVKQLAHDPELAFAEVVDVSNKSLSADVMARPASLDGTIAVEQAIVDGTGSRVGTVRVAYRTEAAVVLRNAVVAAVAISLAVVTVLVGVALTMAARRVVRQIGGEPAAVARIASAVATGDLSTEIRLRSGDTGSVLHAMGAMVGQLRETTRRIREISETIATASSEIAMGNQDLSHRTEQTAGSLQSTASSMEQLTATVSQTAHSAHTANDLASSASGTADKGRSVVAEVVATMHEINGSSKRIADIIGVIDGIAFQTNILALNAAVEAARAGEQGRGFAVVAGEVRNLAQRSAEAAKEIKGLIGTSVERVETGARLVQAAGSTMQEIVESVQRVSHIIGEISVAAAEQSNGIGQVNNSIGQLDQMTQQNSALVEQSAAAAESLRDQARHLAEAVRVFRLEPHEG